MPRARCWCTWPTPRRRSNRSSCTGWWWPTCPTRASCRAGWAAAAGRGGGDEDAAEVQQTLGALHDLARRGAPTAADSPPATGHAGTPWDREGFWAAVETVAEYPASHPGLRGLALVLLEMDGRIA